MVPDKKLFCLSISGAEIPYVLNRSRHRRTLQIAIKDSMEVSVAAPRYLSEQEIEGFIRKKSDWILKKLAERRPYHETLQKRQYADGQEFLFLGRKYPIRILESNARKSSVLFENEQWDFLIPKAFSLDSKEQIKEQLTMWYRFQAKEILGSRLFHFSRIMDLEPKKIVIKTQKNLWGSCSSHTRSIQLNWKLVLAPIDVLDYVIVHELSHLAVPNHSRRFWQRVEKTLPDYRQRQQWLKDNHYEMTLP